MNAWSLHMELMAQACTATHCKERSLPPATLQLEL